MSQLIKIEIIKVRKGFKKWEPIPFWEAGLTFEQTTGVPPLQWSSTENYSCFCLFMQHVIVLQEPAFIHLKIIPLWLILILPFCKAATWRQPMSLKEEQQDNSDIYIYICTHTHLWTCLCVCSNNYHYINSAWHYGNNQVET